MVTAIIPVGPASVYLARLNRIGKLIAESAVRNTEHMQASETTIRKLIEGSKQYVIPLFQRPYSWTQKHWSTLWQDVMDLVGDVNARPHFFGSTVTAPARSVPQGVGKWLLIDGQQRLTTTQLFLAALRDTATHIDAQSLAQKIEGQSLLTAYEVGDEQLKVLPTQGDREAFRAIIRRDSPLNSRLTDCHHFFISRLRDRKGLSGDFLERLYLVVIDRLSLVGITCDEQDNPHLIFESLNAKGCLASAGNGETPSPSYDKTRQEFLPCESRARTIRLSRRSPSFGVT